MFNLNLFQGSKHKQYAALDLGSNSFHLIVANWQDGELKVKDKVKDTVGLGWGLDNNGELDQAAWDRSMLCLSQFGERLESFSKRSVRVVATHAIRSIKNREAFIEAAEKNLGFPIEVISAEEEARLIFLGVNRDFAHLDMEQQRLVIDVGGCCTKLALGNGFDLQQVESIDLGCVCVTKKFFPNSKVNSELLQQAEDYIKRVIAEQKQQLQALNWEVCLGSSGVMVELERVCRAHPQLKAAVTLENIDFLIEKYLEFGDLRLELVGLPNLKKSVFLAGILVLRGVMQALNVTELQSTEWALREGLLLELQGKLVQAKGRSQSICNLEQRFGGDFDYSQRIEKTTREFSSQVCESWDLDQRSAQQWLQWSSHLFQIGLSITHKDSQQHAAYLVQHVDLAGFNAIDKTRLSLLVGAYREAFSLDFIEHADAELIKMAIILRLAIIFNRSEKATKLPEIKLRSADQHLLILIDRDWLESHPLTLADLKQEREHLAALDYRFEISSY